MAEVLGGGCQCGAVRYECGAVPIMAGHCHCRSCQRSSGTGHSSHLMVPRAAVTVNGEASFYERTADSGNRVRQAFCPRCGSPLYGETAAFPDVLMLRAGSLDDPNRFRPGARIFCALAPSWDHMDPALPSFDGMPAR